VDAAISFEVLGFAGEAPLQGACPSYLVSDGTTSVLLECPIDARRPAAEAVVPQGHGQSVLARLDSAFAREPNNATRISIGLVDAAEASALPWERW